MLINYGMCLNTCIRYYSHFTQTEERVLIQTQPVGVHFYHSEIITAVKDEPSGYSSPSHATLTRWMMMSSVSGIHARDVLGQSC